MKRFERFNEMIFESYCMKSVLNAIKKERNRKDARGEVEQSLSTLTDAMLYALSTEDDEMIQAEKPHQIFCIHGRNIPIYDPKLSCALSHLMPADREIVLLYFFRELTDEKIASLVHMSRPTVSRRRKAATRRLRELMEDTS
ncbi:sigma-70 family RNA polymerase sigma factor [Oscillospiraceae bacterium 38-13]